MAEFGPPTALTQQDLLDVLSRNFEPHWIEGLLADPSSLSLFVGTAAALLRLQTALDEDFSIGAFILTAPGRARATSVIRLQRPSGAEVTITTDKRFLDNRGAIWRPTADYVIPAAAGLQTVDMPVSTERAGYYLNSFSVLTYQILDDLPDANLIVIAGPSPATGGKTPFLDQHGRERRVFRSAGESDQTYRTRMLFLADQVSPKAMTDVAVEVLDAFTTSRSVANAIVRDGLRIIREPYKDTAQPAQRNLIGSPGAFADDAFADDIRGHVIRDSEDVLAWFDVLLPSLTDPNEARLFLDDGYLDDPTFGFMDLPPGEAILAPVAALADELDRRRAGGSRFRILQAVDIPTLRHPPTGSLVQAGDWLSQGGLATDAALTAALATYDGDDTYARSVQGRGNAAALAAGDLLFNAPALTVTPLAVRYVVLRALVRKRNVGAGVDPRLAFLIRPSTAGAAQRVLLGGYPLVIDHTAYREYVVILEQNPITAAAWALVDVTGTVGFGVANAAAVGATEELRVSELMLEIVLNYG